MTQHFLLMVGQYGLSLVILNVFIDQLGLPVPAVPTLVMAGGLAAWDAARLPVISQT